MSEFKLMAVGEAEPRVMDMIPPPSAEELQMFMRDRLPVTFGTPSGQYVTVNFALVAYGWCTYDEVEGSTEAPLPPIDQEGEGPAAVSST